MTLSTVRQNAMELLVVLDEDVRHLERTLAHLDTLRSLLIRRQNAVLEQLLDEIRRQAETHESNEQKRQQLRRELAADLGCAPAELTLTRLQAELSEPPRAALAQRQTRLRALAVRLKQEHTLTVLLLQDCSRFNRSLLNVLFGVSGRGGTIYSPTGLARSPIATTLMSTQL